MLLIGTKTQTHSYIHCEQMGKTQREDRGTEKDTEIRKRLKKKSVKKQ